MRTLAVFLAVCVVGVFSSALTDEQKTLLKKDKEECIKETGVNAEIIDAIVKGGTITLDDKLNEFSKCLLKKLQMLKDDGTIDLKVVKEKGLKVNVPQEKIDKVIEKCKDITGKDDAEKAGKTLKCFIEEKEFKLLD